MNTTTPVTFNHSSKTLTFTSLASVALERVKIVVDVTQGVILYSPVDPTLGGTLAGNVLTLALDTTGSGFVNTDAVMAIYDSPNDSPVFDTTLAAQVQGQQDTLVELLSLILSKLAIPDSGGRIMLSTLGGIAPFNLSQFGGNAVATGTGASGSGVPRVTVSSDSSLAANQSVNANQVAGVSATAAYQAWFNTPLAQIYSGILTS